MQSRPIIELMANDTLTVELWVGWADESNNSANYQSVQWIIARTMLKYFLLFTFSSVCLLSDQDTVGDKKCGCMRMKYLRDISPMYPNLKSWLVEKWQGWSNVDGDIGRGREMKVSNVKISRLLPVLFPLHNDLGQQTFLRADSKIALKDFFKSESSFYYNNLESIILTNWVWGPRQNIEASKLIIKPINKNIFDEKNIKLIPRVITVCKYYIRTLLRWLAIINTPNI